MTARPDLQQRIEAVRSRADIAALVGAAVKLSRGGRPRGKCPFHGSRSDSLAVYPDSGRARCWGCGWAGDAFGFVQDFYGLDFMGALERLESDYGLDGSDARPVQREKQVRRWRAPDTVDSAVVAEHLWRIAVPDYDSVRVWLRARRVPEAMLDDHWLGQIRFAGAAPIAAWPVNGRPEAMHHAPAMVALIRRMHVDPDSGERRAVPAGVHATFLSPGLKGKMNRKRANGSVVPARKMFGGSSAGAVILGQYRRDCALYVGEGIETVLSGMALLGAGPDACGLAVLSLGNLQGEARTVKGGALPLFDVRPDPRSPCVAFAHNGPVIGLIDADMKPLRGWKNPQTGELVPPAVIERAGGPVVRRAISTIERAEICASLFAQRWRAAGCRRVRTERPRAGMDFNDVARESA